MITDFLTEEGDRLSCVASVGASAKSRVRRHTFQPMAMMGIEYEQRRGARIQRLIEARIAEPHVSLTTDACKLSMIIFLSEFLCYATPCERQNPSLFAYTANSMRWLDGCSSPAANFHLVFMMRVARFIGFLPNTEGYSEGDVFDLQQAVFTSSPPLHGNYLDSGDSARMLKLMRMDYNTMHLFRMSRAERNRITDIILFFYRLHVPGFPEMRSLGVLRELWE